MKRPAKTLPIKPPRTCYNPRDAYRGRVWRTPWTVVARELFFWALGLTLLSVAVNDVRWMLYCMVAVILPGIIAVSASISKNRTRVRIIRTGLPPRRALDIQDEFRSYMSCFGEKGRRLIACLTHLRHPMEPLLMEAFGYVAAP